MKVTHRGKLDAIRLETENVTEVVNFCNGRPVYLGYDLYGVAFRPTFQSSEDLVVQFSQYIVKIGSCFLVFSEEDFNNIFRYRFV